MRTRIRSEVKKLPGYHLDQPRCKIKLNQNESPYDLPGGIKSEVLARLAETPWNRYPSPYADRLTQKIAHLNHWNPEGVLVANGSNVLTKALVAVTALGASLVLPDPTFLLYEIYGRLFKNRIYRVPLKSDFSLEPSAFVRKVKEYRPQLVFLANPNAPTGRLLEREDLETIIQATSGLVVVDEAYFPFSGETLRSRLRHYKNLVLLRTFSKAFSLGGVRIGYLMAHPEVTREVKKAIPPFSVSVVTSIIAETLLENPGFVMKLVKEVVGERERIYVKLKSLRGVTSFPSSANFILFRTRRSKAVYEGLLKKGILIRNVSDDRRLKNCLRVTIGTRKENNQFLGAMKKLV